MSWILKYRARALAIICGCVTLLGVLIYLVAFPDFVAGILLRTYGEEREDPNVPSDGEIAAGTYRYWVDWEAIKSIRNVEYQTRDYRLLLGPMAPKHPDLVYLAVDDPTITQENLWPEEIEQSEALQLMKGGYPFNRAIYARVLDKLVEAGAKVVMFDFMFIGPKEGDEELKAALERHKDKVVVGVNFVNQQGVREIYKADSLGLASPTLVPSNIEDDRFGSINVFPDQDSVLRDVRYNFLLRLGAEEGTPMRSIVAQGAVKAGYGDRIPPDYEAHTMRYAGKPYTFKPNSLYEIFVPTYWEGREIDGEVIPGKYRKGEFFRDKIVMVGPEGHILKDEMLTPFNSMPGPEIHLNALNALLTNSFIYQTPPWVDLICIVMAGLLAWLIMYVFKTAWLAGIGFVIVGFGYLAFSQYLYNAFDAYIMVFLPFATFLTSGSVGMVAEFFAERLERSRTRSTLERFVARNIVKEVLENPDSFYNKLGGTRLPITVLFSDVRGFTTMTEESDPEQLVAQLNEYLRQMGEAVQMHNGILDKFIGDAVMATWGNINSQGYEEDAKLAVAAALEMRQRLAGLNAAWDALGWRTWQFGIGLHQGEAIVGSIGSDKIKQDPTVIGDTVNTGARMESSTKKYKVDLLISDVMKPHLERTYHLQSVDKVVFKGKTKAVETFTVIDAKSTELDGETVAYLKLYHEALETFRPPKRDFAQARELFLKAQEHRPGDHLCDMYIERCNHFEKNPPPEDWQGEEVATSK